MARREATTNGPGSRALIVDLVRSSGSISRTELAVATGLTQPSISLIVRKLINDGIVVESGETAATGGKPRAMLTINSRAAVGIGMQLGFEGITIIAADTAGGIIGRQRVFGAMDDDPNDVLDRMIDLYNDFLDALALDRSLVVGLGVVSPGPIDVDHGKLLAPPSLAKWHGFNLRRRLHKALGVPVIMDNDAAAAAIGEFWSRQVSRGETFAVVYMGTGIGAGLVLDGALYRGASSNAGELGHITIIAGGRECFCGNEGCLERYAAPEAVVALARADDRLSAELQLDSATSTIASDFDELSRAAIRGNSSASALIEASAAHVATAVLSFSNLLDLNRIVLAGPGFAGAGSIYVRAIRDRLGRSLFARAMHSVVVELASNPREAAAAGAGALVLQSTVAPGHGRSPNVD